MARFLMVLLLASCVTGSTNNNLLKWHQIFSRNLNRLYFGGTKQFVIKTTKSECLSLCDNSKTLSDLCHYGFQCITQPQDCNAFVCTCWIKATCHESFSKRPLINQVEFQLERFDRRQIQDIISRHPGTTTIKFNFPSRSRYDLLQECQCDRSLLQNCPSRMHCEKWSDCSPGQCVCNLTLGCFPLFQSEPEPSSNHSNQPQQDMIPIFSQTRFTHDLKTLLNSGFNETSSLVYVTEMDSCAGLCKTGSNANGAKEQLQQCDGGLKCHSSFENCAPFFSLCECKVSLTCHRNGNEAKQSTPNGGILSSTFAGNPPQSKEADQLELAALFCKSIPNQTDCRKEAIPKCQEELEQKCPSSLMSQGGICTFLYRGDFMEDNCCYKLECPRETLGNRHEYSPDRIETDTISADRVIQSQTPLEKKSLLSPNNEGLHLSTESLANYWNTFETISLGENRTISLDKSEEECRHICGKAALRSKPICHFGTLCFAEFGPRLRGQFGNCSITLYCWGDE